MQKYVVYFYLKDFTPSYTTEGAEFARDYKKFKVFEKVKSTGHPQEVLQDFQN